MAGLRIEGNISGRVAEVDTNSSLLVNAPLDESKSGILAIAAELHNGEVGAARLVRSAEISPDYRLRVGVDTPLWNDVFNHTVLNTSKYAGVTSTATIALAGGKMTLNAGNSVASGAVARVQTFRTFPLYLSYALYADFEVSITQPAVLNNVIEVGLGYAATTAAPTDGVFFRVNASGQLLGVINNNGAETQINLNFVPTANAAFHALIMVHNDRTEFWIDDILYGAINTPTATGSPCQSMSLPLLIREYNSAATGTAQQLNIMSISVSLADMNNTRLWATQMAGMGQSCVNAPDSATAGSTANYANTAAPASATLSNTAAGYTTLGGQFQFAAVAGAETDYALFAFLVPAGSAAVPAKNLIVRGVRIDTYNSGAAAATTATVLQWALGAGSTGASLATADSATTGTRAPRRLALGIQAFPIAAAIGTLAAPVDVNLDAPIMVETGTYLHIILKMPLGTATASQIIRGTVMINGYFE